MSDHAHDGHDPSFYVKTWGILVVLLIISVVGPMFEIRTLTLITAFGIAVVKAVIVARRFMHINVSPAFISYIIMTCLVFMALFFFATAPDVMKADGSNWVKEQQKWQYEAVRQAHHGGGDHGGGNH
jgi:caa(3)-type oxidase subunit IV